MSEPRNIYAADPHAAFAAHESELRQAIDRVLRSGHYILGPEVEAFEREWASWLGVSDAVAVANGTEALELALRVLGVGPGDTVATVANTVSATAAAIQQTGASIAWVDVDDDTMTMSPESLAKVLSEATQPIKVVMPVHLYGRPADMPAIITLAARHGAKVIEDCAQAHGAVLAGRKVGCWGDVAAFSFYPTKNLGALGDGGAVVTHDGELTARLRRLRQYGWRQRYVSEEPGRNSRLDELQAAVLRVKLRHLDAENTRRGKLAEHYLTMLRGQPLQLPLADGGGVVSAWHQFAVRLPDRAVVQERLAQVGIHCGVLYPVPLHKQPAYVQDVSLPRCERACADVLCLPVHPALTTADVDRVASELIRCLHV